MMGQLIQIFMAFLGALGFSVLFNVRGRKLFYAGFGGMISWSFYLVFKQYNASDFVPNCLAAMVATIYAEIFARFLKTPTTTFLSAAIIPLVPGGLLYYTMNFAVTKSTDKFMAYGERTMVIAMALACGIMLVSSVERLIEGIRTYRQQGGTTG